MKENGELHQMWEKWQPKEEDCFPNVSEAIKMESLVSAFALLVTCLCISIFLLLLEIACNHYTKQKVTEKGHFFKVANKRYYFRAKHPQCYLEA